MTHNVLSRKIDTLPMWVVQAVVGVLLTSGIAWATWASVTTWKHDGQIAVVEDHQKGIDKSLDEIKDGQKDMNHKLDRLLEQRNRGR